MARVDLAITIKRPVSDVFAVLTTPEFTPRWSANATREWVTSEGPGPGPDSFGTHGPKSLPGGRWYTPP